MKYLTRIDALHFKGRDFQFEFQPVTVIHGDNSQGKTAITDAGRIVLLGYSPRHGRQAAKTFGFCGAPNGATEMKVRGTFSDNGTVERIWALKKGSVKFTGHEGELVPPVMLDASEFLKKSGPEKTRFIFNLIDLAGLGFSTEKVTARLKADIKVETPTPESEGTLCAIIDSVNELAEFRDHEKQTYQEWIEAVIEHLKTCHDAAKAVAADMEGHIGATTQLRALDGLQPKQNVTAELEQARKRFMDATTRAADLVRQATEHKTRLARKRTLESTLAGLPDRSEEIGDMTRRHEEQIERLKAYKSLTFEIVARLTNAQAGKATAEKTIAEMDEQIAARLSKLNEDLKADFCPHCKSKGKGWKESLKKSVEKEIEGDKEIISDLKKQLRHYGAEVETIQQELNQSKDKDAQTDKMRAENFTLGQQITQARSRQGERDSTVARLAELADIGQPVEQDALNLAATEKETARREVERLEDLERQQIAGMNDAKRAEQARQTHAVKLIDMEIYKLALKSLAALQGDMMTAAFAGFMEKMNLIGDGILPGRLVFHDGEIGYWAGASFAALSYFGGTEELLTFAGLSLTLAKDTPIRIIIMDELGRIAAKKKRLLLERMIQFVRNGIIDQFIGIDVSKSDYVDLLRQPEFGLIEVK